MRRTSEGLAALALYPLLFVSCYAGTVAGLALGLPFWAAFILMMAINTLLSYPLMEWADG